MKRILFALIASAALFSFISCDNDSKPSEQPPNSVPESQPSEQPSNSFTGKTFIGSCEGYLVSYIEFTSNTECKIYNRGMTEPVPITYQVSDDIATLPSLMRTISVSPEEMYIALPRLSQLLPGFTPRE